MSRAFLIGAGATRAEYPDAPLTDDFLRLLGRGNHRNPELYDSIKEAVRPYIDVRQLDDVSIETLMNMSDKFPPDARNTFLASVHYAIYELLASTTQSDTTYIQNYLANQITRKESLFKALLMLLDKDDFFMTLNYDLYLDREVLFMNQGFIDYGITDDFRINSGDNFALPPRNQRHFSVYHLHGSLNWEISHNKINVHRGARRPRYDGNGSSVCIIPPGKKALNPPLKSIWEIAEGRLKNANELIIIGCSLNPLDKELIDLIKKGPDKIKVIDWDDTLGHTLANEENTTNISLGKRCRTYHYGFRLNPPSGGQRAFDFIFS